MESVDLARRIQAFLRWSVSRRKTERIGPFLATFSEDPNPYLNYAIPDEGASPSPTEVAGLIAAYRRGLKPRLEYVPGLAPQVEGALLKGGFQEESRTPLMIVAGQGVPDLAPPDGVELAVPRSDEDLRGALIAQHEAYDAGPPQPGDLTRVRQAIANGCVYLLARDVQSGEPAGAGMLDTPHDGLTELAGVGVRAAYRRRGIAAALTAQLARMALASDVTPFLMAAGESEARIYRRAGFVRCGEVLHISVPAV